MPKYNVDIKDPGVLPQFDVEDFEAQNDSDAIRLVEMLKKRHSLGCLRDSQGRVIKDFNHG